MLAICSGDEFLKTLSEFRKKKPQKKKNGWLMFMSSTKRGIIHFHVVLAELCTYGKYMIKMTSKIQDLLRLYEPWI